MNNKGLSGKKLFIKRDTNEKQGEDPDNAVNVEGENDITFELEEPTNQTVKNFNAKNNNNLVERDNLDTFTDENTILIKRTLRSGQSIHFDGNVVILGDVNPGAEIIASGNIVVMGALRGVVHAGATGDEEASVSAFRLQPTQLRIANHITRAPDGEYLTPEYPEIASIKDGVVVIEIYQVGQERQAKIG